MPGTKRARPEEEDEEDLKARNDKAISTLFDELDAIETSSEASGLVTKASLTFLKLKSIQHSLLEQVKDTRQALEKKRHKLEQQKMQLASLDYEEAFLNRNIQTQVATPQLERMCRDEASPEQQADLSTEELMNEFLCGTKSVSYKDPSQHKTVLAKLHQEINARGRLERDTTKAQAELAEMQTKISQNQDFLKDFPKKLDSIERASLPLQKFFAEAKQDDDSPLLIGTERSKRLQLAQSLPKALYTLFVQLQSHLDASPDHSVSLEVATKTKFSSDDAALFMPDAHAVRLHFTLPDTLPIKKKQTTTIEFLYLAKLRLVTAQATGTTTASLSTLLPSLFPGDTGTVIWSDSSFHLRGKEMPGVPYHWCNYLSGMHGAGSAINDPLTTKAVMVELKRRVHAHATLQYLLDRLEKRNIPLHPNCKSTSTAKLTAWTTSRSTESNGSLVKTFQAILRKGSSTLQATVTIDMTRYPSVPPKWCVSTSTSGEHLYDNDWGRIQDQVNTNLQDLLVDEDEAWILSHQLHKILEMWQDSAATTRKGRDRRAIVVDKEAAW